jgi:adenine-specific DNA-methyltransferase
MPNKYDDLSKPELIRLLEARDRRDATRFGLVWEANEIERDRALNSDFVALDLVPEHSCGSAPYENLIIEGDNFDALRALRLSHAGQVKCIYIDPPYNTGNRDFVYNDSFVDREDSWRHSKWCEFMFQRLILAKDLLREDGVIFVSIDDNEMAALRLLMDRVFGAGNFVANFIWKKVDSPNDNKVAITPDHEFILCFALNSRSAKFDQVDAPHILEAYGGIDSGGRRYRDRLVKKNGKNSLRKDRPTMFFPIIDPDGNEVYPIHDNGEEARWAMGKDAVIKHRQGGTLVWKKKQKLGAVVWEPYAREYAPDLPARPYPTIWADLPTMRQAKTMLRDIFNTADLFSTPKPVELIARILKMAAGPRDIILDFFAGSGTTAHAVLKMNAEDGGKRRFILVSSTEATTEEPEKNLCRDVCATRVRRVIEGYGDQPGTGSNFAYLRTRRIPPGRLVEIEHAEVWTALQLLHCKVVSPFEGDGAQVAGGAEETLVYVPRFSRKHLSALQTMIAEARSVIVYSWQPELLRQHLPGGHIQHEGMPEAFARRFGLKGVA